MTRTTQLATTIAARAAAAHQTIAEYLADEAMRISAIRLGRATEDALAQPRQQTRAWLAGEAVRTTAGKGGVPALPAIRDPDDDDHDGDPFDDTLSIALQVAQHGRSSTVLLVDGDRVSTILIGAAATTPEDVLC